MKVLTIGVWDLFHSGHLNLIKYAKSLGDILIVAVASDYAVEIEPRKKYKTVIKSEDRLRIIQNQSEVDFAYIYSENKDLEKSIELLKPDIICRGDDWQNYPGKKIADRLKIKTMYFPNKGEISSTLIKESIFKKAY